MIILENQLCSFCNFTSVGKSGFFRENARSVYWEDQWTDTFKLAEILQGLVLHRKSLWYEDTSYFPPAWKCVLLWDNRLIPFLSPCLSGEQRVRKAVESGFENRLEHFPVWLYWRSQRGWIMGWWHLEDTQRMTEGWDSSCITVLWQANKALLQN